MLQTVSLNIPHRLESASPNFACAPALKIRESRDMVTFSGQSQKPCILRTPAFREFCDDAGFIKAGHVLKLIDYAGSEPALKFLNQNGFKGLVVTASLDRTDFKAPIHPWEVIQLESQITQVWKSSLETQVKVKAQHPITGETRDIANSYLVFVALDPKTRQKMTFPTYIPKGKESRRLVSAAELRKQNRIAEGKTAPFIPIEDQHDQPVIVRRVMTANDTNSQSNIFGGVILSLIDEAGSQAAKKQALDQTVVGVRQDRMSFIAPTFVGETVESKAIITKSWNTSMEVQVEVDAVNPNTNQRRRVASSYLVYVKLGNNARPAEVPSWTPVTEAQKQRAERADMRRQIREDEEKASVDYNQLKPSPLWKHWLQRLKRS